MKRNKICIILLILSQLFVNAQNDSVRYMPDYSPDRVMLTIPGNPATERAVSWRTRFDVTKSYGQILEATAGVTPDTVFTVEGTNSQWEKGSSYAMGHKVIFTGLKPNTLYSYRVGDSLNWSEWFQFRTASKESDPFSVIYFGDMQNGIKSYCSRNIRQAFMHQPDASFMLFAGDLVNRSYEEYWREFFYAGGFIFGTIPTVATPGNHEYYKYADTTLPRTFSRHWESIFTNPQNGPKTNRNNAYSFIYQGVKFISLDTYFFMEQEEDKDSYLLWLENTLKTNSTEWTVVFFHHPVYSCSHNRNNEILQTRLKPLLEKYNVDLVLQGHDHTYCRGQNLKETEYSSERAPMYVVSVGGSKMYGLATEKWSDRVSSKQQLFQVINFDGNKLEFKTYTVTGKLYDSFLITKNNNGNKIIEVNPDIQTMPESTTIPERYLPRYSEEERAIFNKTYKKN